MTLVELLVGLTVLALIMSLGVPGFKSLVKKAEINNALRTVTTVVNTARYLSVQENHSIKVTVEDNKFFLSRKRFKKWIPFKEFDPGEKVTVSMNTSPIFYPEGFIVPLCSIYVKSPSEHYRITISAAGRLKVALL